MYITFIQTGGTIDKNYPRTETTHGYNFEIGEAAAAAVLAKIKPAFAYDVISILKKDSLDFTDDDRKKVLDTVAATSNEHIIITHGTDTIYQTAQVLAKIPQNNKKIILTGAMLPAVFHDSDAMFNLGMAVGAMFMLREPGVYIALHGVVVAWDQFPSVHIS